MGQEFWRFYWEVARRAFTGKFWRAEQISGAFALFFAVGAWFLGWESAVNWVPFLVFLAVFVGTVAVGMIVAPYAMWSEQKARILELQDATTPKLTIDGVEQMNTPQDMRHYLLVRNKSRSVGLTDCLARIEELTDESGARLLRHWVLRTEHQVGDRPKGRFTLDPDQTKRIVIAEPAGNPGFGVRLIGAEDSKKLPTGKYSIRLRVTTRDGEPTEVRLKISGNKVAIDQSA